MLGKRERSMVTAQPSEAKHARQESGGDKAGSSSPRMDAGVMTAAFLAACASCGKGLGPGKDTYIYRGEVAFCSHECRERYIQLVHRGQGGGPVQSGNSTKNH